MKETAKNISFVSSGVESMHYRFSGLRYILSILFFSFGMTMPGLSFQGGETPSSPILEITSATPSTLAINPYSGSDVVITFGFDYANYTLPDPSQFWFTIYTDQFQWWNGDTWVQTENHHSLNDPHPFWSSWSIDTTAQTLTLRAPASYFNANFWEGAASRIIYVTLSSPSPNGTVGGSFTLGPLFLDGPSPIVTNFNQTNYTLNPNTTGGLAFGFDFSVPTSPPGALYWAWEDPVSGNSWDGSQWQNELITHEMGAGTGFWSGVNVTSSSASASFDIPATATPIWDGNRQIRLRFFWLRDSMYFESENPVTLDINWAQLPAPANITPTGTVSNPNTNISWSPVTGAEGYAILLFEPGAYSQTAFLNSADAPENNTTTNNKTVTIPTPYVNYDIYMSTKLNNVWGPPTKVGNILSDGNPDLTITNFSQTLFSIMPNTSGGVSFDFDYNVAAGYESGAPYWAWEDIGSGKFWDGAQWNDSLTRMNLTSSSGFWTGINHGSNQITASFDIPETATPFWDGDRQIKIRYFWNFNGNYYESAQSTTLDINWTQLPAPNNVTPNGTVYVSNPQMSWAPINGATRYGIQLFEPGTFTQNAFTASVNSSQNNTETTYKTVAIPQQNQTYDVYMATKKGNDWGDAAKVGTLRYEEPILTHGTASTSSVSIDFSTGASASLTLPFTWQNIESFDPSKLKWKWHTNVNGNDYYYRIATSNGPRWTDDNSFVTPQVPPSVKYSDRIELNLNVDDFPLAFWKPDPTGNYMDLNVSISLAYQSEVDLHPFQGIPYQVQFTRTGSSPVAPAPSDLIFPSGGSTSNILPTFEWNTIPGASYYHVSITGIFDDGTGLTRTITNQGHCGDETQTTFRLKDPTSSPHCEYIGLIYGNDYTFSISAGNALGVSSTTNWTIHVDEPIIFADTSNQQIEIVDGCDQTRGFSLPLSQVTDDFNPDNFMIYMKRMDNPHYWNGTGWQQEKVGFPLSHANSFWNGFSVTGDMNGGTFDFSFNQADFPPDFWIQFGTVPGQMVENGADQGIFLETEYYNGNSLIGFNNLQPIEEIWLYFTHYELSPPDPVEMNCYVLSPTPTLTWDPVPFADSYKLTVYERDSQGYPNVFENAEVTASNTYTLVGSLDPTLEYVVDISTTISGCESEFATVFPYFQYVYPGVTDRNIQVISQPTGDLVWDFYQYGGPDSIQLDLFPHTVRMEGENFDYPLHCSQLVHDLIYEVIWVENPGGSGLMPTTSRTHLFGYGPEVLTRETGLDYAFEGTATRKLILDNIRNEVLPSNPNAWKTETYNLRMTYEIRDRENWVEPLANGSNQLPKIGWSDHRTLRFRDVSNYVTSLELDEPTPDTLLVPLNPTEAVESEMTFSYTLDNQKPFLADVGSIAWVWKTYEVQGGNPNPVEKFWNGVEWVDNRSLMRFNNHPDGTDAFNLDNAIDWENGLITMSILSSKFPDNFFPADLEDGREVFISLVYQNNGLNRPEVESNTQVITFYKQQSLVVNNLELSNISPKNIEVPLNQTGAKVRFTVTFKVDRTPPTLPINGFTEDATWSIESVNEPGYYWSGSGWIHSEQNKPFANHSSGAATGLFSGVTLDEIQFRIDADIASEQFQGFFLGEQTEKAVYLRLTHERDGTTVVSPPLAATFRIIDFEPNILWWDEPMGFLHNLTEVEDAYAPEPLFLEGNSWILGKSITHDVSTFNQSAQLAAEEIAWIRVNRPQDRNFDVLSFVAVYPDYFEGSNSYRTYSNRTPVDIDVTTLMPEEWTQTGTLFYRYYPNYEVGPNGEPEPDRLVIVVFAPESLDLMQTPSLNPQSLIGFSQNPATSFLGNNDIDLLDSIDNNHNRLLTISHLNDSDSTEPRKLYSIAFSDLLGKGQEVRAFGSHVPQGLSDGDMLVSGITQLDALGRETKAVKGLTQTMSNLGDFANAPSRDATFNLAKAYWNQDHKLPEDHTGNQWTYAHKDDFGNEPFVQNIYENDARSRILATMPFGALSHNINTLRYNRFHYFFIPAPDLKNMTINGELVGFYNLPQIDGEAGSQPALLGKLAIDPNGSVIASFTGNDTETVLLSVANPSVSLLQSWGLEVQLGQPSVDLSSNRVYLPGNYETRIQKNQNASKNLASLSYLDRFGLLKATFPPRSINIDPLDSSLTLVNSNLVTTYSYNELNLMVESNEPDAGISKFIYNDVGQLRFTHNAGQSQSIWTEHVYDDMKNTILLQQVSIPGGTPTPTEVENSISTYTALNNTSIHSRYDRYSSDAMPSNFNSVWPTEEQILEFNPYLSQGQTIALWPPSGQLAEMRGPESAERYYYDAKGRLVCRVVLYKELMEPQIIWNHYDRNDLLLGSWHKNTGLAFEYQYDAWNRLVGIRDLDPSPIRTLVTVASDNGSGGSSIETEGVGPLVGAAGSRTQPFWLARYIHTPTGHIARVNYGGQTQDPNDYSYRVSSSFDIRDWMKETKIEAPDQDLYSTELEYFGVILNVGAGQLSQGYDVGLYNGTITQVNEEYGIPLGEGEHSQMTQTYDYDATYQLIMAQSKRGSLPEINQSYTYDRNGNRLSETRDRVPVKANTPSTNIFTLDHTINASNNQVTRIKKTESGVTEDRIIFGDDNQDDGYDNLGNVTIMNRYDHEGNYITQHFYYEDLLHPILPTRIEQTAVGPDGQTAIQDLAFEHEYVYDHSGTRIKKTVITENEDGTFNRDVTRFVPSGVENLAELDQYGRTKRAYLFAGNERIGYKSSRDTAVYIKDHLGSTKMTLALFDSGSATVPQPSFSSAVLNPNLAAQWHFDGNYEDSGTGQHTMTPSPGVSLDSGFQGQGVNIADGAGFVKTEPIPGISYDINNFTISTWARHNNLAGIVSSARIWESGPYNTSGFLLQLMAVGSMRLITHQPDNNVYFHAPAGSWPDDGNWHQVTLVKLNDLYTIYIDGSQVASGTLPEPDDSSFDFLLGNNDSLTRPWSGSMDEVIMETRALSAVEIQQKWSEQKTLRDATTLDAEAVNSLAAFSAQTIEQASNNHYFSSTAHHSIISSEFIPIDKTSAYYLSGRFKSAGTTDSKLYFGFVCYDEEKNPIDSNEVERYGNKGVIVQTSATQITTENGLYDWKPAGEAAIRRAIGFYYDGDDTHAPDFVWTNYTNSQSTDSTQGAYSLASGNSLTINGPLPQEVLNNLQIGVTAIRNHGAGAAYNYAGAVNKTIPNVWTNHQAFIAGEAWGAWSYNNFRPGTRYVKLLVIGNYAQYGNDAILHMDDLRFEKLKDFTSVTNKPQLLDAEGDLDLAYMPADNIDLDGSNRVYSQSSTNYLRSSDFISINPEIALTLSGKFRSTGTVESKMWYGLVCYDENFEEITAQKVIRVGNDAIISNVSNTQISTTTTLSGWNGAGTQNQVRSLGFYYDGDTNHLPDDVIIWHPTGVGGTTEGAFQSVSGSVINLSRPLPPEVLAQINPGVTVVKNHTAGNNYIRPAAQNVTVPFSWTTYTSGTLMGEAWGAGNYNFRPGTRYVKFLIQPNYGQNGQDVNLQFDDLRFERQDGAPNLDGGSVNSYQFAYSGVTPTPFAVEDRLLLKASDTGPYGLQFREIYRSDLDPKEDIESHGFTGQEKETDLGLYYYGARFYMPEIGRLQEVDPLEDFTDSYKYLEIQKEFTNKSIDDREQKDNNGPEVQEKSKEIQTQ